jgi:hypothetical protein
MSLGHGTSSFFLVLFVAMFAVRMLAGRRRRSPGGRSPAGRAGFVSSPVDAPGATASRHPGIPAGWMVDPAGRFDQRYWSGSEWTEHVTRGGVASTDPPPGTPANPSGL